MDSFFPGSGEHLTPNLVPGALSGGGDTITLTTVLRTRTYVVASVEKASVNDSSGTAPTTDVCPLCTNPSHL